MIKDSLDFDIQQYIRMVRAALVLAAPDRRKEEKKVYVVFFVESKWTSNQYWAEGLIVMRGFQVFDEGLGHT